MENKNELSESPSKRQIKFLLNSPKMLMKKSIPLSLFIQNNKTNKYFFKNGISKIVPRLQLKVESNMEKCFNLWEKFSQKKSLFDLWDFRYGWYQGYKYQPYFYTLYEKNRPLAVLPLWFDEEDKKYEWFGSDWMEDCQFFVKDEKYIDLLFQIMPTPIYINAVEVTKSMKNKPFFKKMKPDYNKNIKDISKFKSVENVLNSFDKKHRYNLRHDVAYINDFHPRIVFTSYKDKNVFNRFIKLNTLRFDGMNKESSDLIGKTRRKAFYSFVKNSGVYKTKFIEVYIQNHLAAIDIVIEYKDTYYIPRGSNDINRFKGIGNYMIYIEYEDAIRNRRKLVDCLQVDYGWKHRYFDQKKVYKFEK